MPNGAHLYFRTNARTAQSYHGNFYFDEFFWVPKFAELNKVASGMALHKHWRKTYFSTPSSMAHEAYPLWTGDVFNKRRAKRDQVAIELAHSILKNGHQCDDRIWRQIVTILDAEAGGCNLFDIDELRLEYSPDQFENLLMCGFIDDTASIFPLSSCRAAWWIRWSSGSMCRNFCCGPTDTGRCWWAMTRRCREIPPVVSCRAAHPGGKFRVLEYHQFRGWTSQRRPKD